MKGRNRAVGGLVFAVGLIGGLIGFMTDAYSPTVAVIIMLGVWFIGGAIAAVLLRGKGA